MSIDAIKHAWLPDRQLHVAATLGHADELIARAGDILHQYLKPGPFELENVEDGALAHLTVRKVSPLPAAVSRYAADALTQLRAAIEHAIFAEVEHGLGRTLTADEAKRTEMPASTDWKDFADWVKGRKRPELAPLREGTLLIQRIRDLQPYQHKYPDMHPMRVLAEHTNFAKHRSPSVAAVHLGAVISDHASPGLVLPPNSGRPVRAGDVLASGPKYEQVGMDIWPKVAMQRPHTGTWHVVMIELGYLEEWVRTVALPILITGTTRVEPLPPQLDTTIGHVDLRSSLATAPGIPAAKRSERRIMADTLREQIAEILGDEYKGVSRDVIRDWFNQLDDEAVLARHDSLSKPAIVRDAVGTAAVLKLLIDEIQEHETMVATTPARLAPS